MMRIGPGSMAYRSTGVFEDVHKLFRLRARASSSAAFKSAELADGLQRMPSISWMAPDTVVAVVKPGRFTGELDGRRPETTLSHTARSSLAAANLRGSRFPFVQKVAHVASAHSGNASDCSLTLLRNPSICVES